MVYDGKNRIPYRIDRRLTGLAGPDYDAPISFGLPIEPEDSQYGKYRMKFDKTPNGWRHLPWTRLFTTAEGVLRKRLGPTEIVLAAALLVVAAYMRLSHLVYLYADVEGLRISIDRPFPPPPIDTASGGLFLAFAGAIADNGYILPTTLPNYTDGGIPFAYPPLSFLLEAVLVHMLSVPDHIAVNALPPVIALLAVPSFYMLTRVLGLPLGARLLALFVFATARVAFSPQIEPEGLAEAAGTLSLVWLAIGLKHVYDNPKPGWRHLLAGAALGICVMASPGSAYGSAAMCLGFAAWQIASCHGLRREAMTGMTVIAVAGVATSAPYIIPVLVNHGPDAFIEPFANENGSLVFRIIDVAQTLSRLAISGSRELFLLNAAVAVGLTHELIKRRWWMAVWFAGLLVIPREGSWMAAIPGCLLAGIGINWLISMWFGRLLKDGRRVEAFGVAAALVVLAAVGINEARDVGIREASRQRAPVAFVDVLNRSASTLPRNAKVITLVEEDWSPLLLRRDVLNMIYGSEWQPGEREAIKAFRAELNECDNFECVRSLAHKKFGYRDMYFVATDDRVAELCGEPTVDGQCSDVEVIESGEGLVVGKFS